MILYSKLSCSSQNEVEESNAVLEKMEEMEPTLEDKKANRIGF
jgi:hypothetical protein